jgi:hypothetical protein
MLEMGDQRMAVVIAIGNHASAETTAALGCGTELRPDAWFGVGFRRFRLQRHALDPNPIEPAFGDPLEGMLAHDEPNWRSLIGSAAWARSATARSRRSG